VAPSRTQKRWSGRLRTGGARLALVGAGASGDRLLPGSREWMLPTGAQLAAGATTLAVGLVAFVVGRRWQ
jgi:hypothetical protein